MSVFATTLCTFGAEVWAGAWPLLWPNRGTEKFNASTCHSITLGSRFRISKPLLRARFKGGFSDSGL
jgi:hypothetical protein